MKRLRWVLITLVLACSSSEEDVSSSQQPISDDQAAEGEMAEPDPQAETVDVPPDQMVQPAPISMVAVPVPTVPSMSPLEILAGRLKAVGPTVLVIRAKVVSIDAFEGDYPAATAWGEGHGIQTKATLSVEEVYCRSYLPSSIDVVYRGGRLASGMWAFSSYMTRDLNTGETAIFILKSVSAGWVLEGGNLTDMLSASEVNSSFVSPVDGSLLETAEIKGTCP